MMFRIQLLLEKEWKTANADNGNKYEQYVGGSGSALDI